MPITIVNAKVYQPSGYGCETDGKFSFINCHIVGPVGRSWWRRMLRLPPATYTPFDLIIPKQK